MSEADSTLPDHAIAGSGKPIVLIPGMEGVKEFWHHQWDAFAARYRTISCGYVRLGLSLKRTVADYASGILRVLDSLGIERAAIAGESFGGLIAQELAIEHGRRVAALVLCNTLDRPRPGGFGLNAATAATLVHPLAFVVPRRLAKPILCWVGRHRGSVLDPSPGNGDLADYLLEHGLAPGVGGYLDRIVAGLRARYTERLAARSARRASFSRSRRSRRSPATRSPAASSWPSSAICGSPRKGRSWPSSAGASGSRSWMGGRSACRA